MLKVSNHSPAAGSWSHRVTRSMCSSPSPRHASSRQSFERTIEPRWCSTLHSDASDPTKRTSATRGANYTLINKDTGQDGFDRRGAVQRGQSHDRNCCSSRCHRPNTNSLSSPSIESEQGIPIGGNGFATTFRVFEDVSLSASVSYSNTRVNRADGTLLFDVIDQQHRRLRHRWSDQHRVRPTR